MSGMMVEYTKEVGKMIRWMVSGSSVGLMEENTKVNTKKIKSKGLVWPCIFSYGEFEWPDGKKYHGQWLEGKQNGKGIFFG